MNSGIHHSHLSWYCSYSLCSHHPALWFVATLSCNSRKGNNIFIPSSQRQKQRLRIVNNLTNPNQTAQTLCFVSKAQTLGHSAIHFPRARSMIYQGPRTPFFKMTLNWIPNSLWCLLFAKVLQRQDYFPSFLFLFLSFSKRHTLFTFSILGWLSHFCFRKGKHQYLKYVSSIINSKNLHRSQHKPQEVKTVSRWLSQICFNKWNCHL